MADDVRTPETHKPTASRQDKPEDADKNNPANSQDALDERLDDGLEETFPSSDPVSVKITK